MRQLGSGGCFEAETGGRGIRTQVKDVEKRPANRQVGRKEMDVNASDNIAPARVAKGDSAA